MNEVAKFTDYAVNTPNFFLDFITTEIKKRDLKGLTGGRVAGASISGSHPLVCLTEAVLASGSTEIDFSSIIPGISVIENEENEDYTTIGDGKRVDIIITQRFIDDCRAVPQKERVQDGLISDYQLQIIEQHLQNTISQSPDGNGYLIAEMEGFYLRENMFVSVWTHSVDERNAIGNVMRSILFDMKKAMRAADLKDTQIRTDKGLVNTNFGRILHGQESSINYINFFHNITVYDEFPTRIKLANCEKIETYNAITEKTEEICKSINVEGKFRANGYPEDNFVDPNPGSELEEE